MSLYQILKELPRPIIHKVCRGCNGCKLSSDHIIPVSTLRALSLSKASEDPHNVFLICHSLNKRKADKEFHTTELQTLLTDEGKGAIARSILYMEYKYGIKTYDHTLMKLWSQLYPPSINEINRYKALKSKYGINPYLE